MCVQRGIKAWWILIPLSIATWVLMHESGVHATVAGVLLGFAVPVHRSVTRRGQDLGAGMAEYFEHKSRPISAGIAIPVFAFFAAGVSLGGFSGLANALGDPITLGIVLGLVAGKPIGIFLTTWALSMVTRAELDSSLKWIDVLGVSMLAGIGFTVSLLIGDLAYADPGVKNSSKSGCWSAQCWRRRWPRCCWPPETPHIGGSRSPKRPMTIMTVCPTSISLDRTEGCYVVKPDGMLKQIRGPADLQRLSQSQLDELAGEIREFLIHKVAATGGHLGPNLGVVGAHAGAAPGLRFAARSDHLRHRTPSYVHKILTGRADGFDQLR